MGVALSCFLMAGHYPTFSACAFIPVVASGVAFCNVPAVASLFPPALYLIFCSLLPSEGRPLRVSPGRGHIQAGLTQLPLLPLLGFQGNIDPFALERGGSPEAQAMGPLPPGGAYNCFSCRCLQTGTGSFLMGQMGASISSSAGMKDGSMASIRRRGIPSTSQLAPPPSLSKL